jgi:hypothetical protein
VALARVTTQHYIFDHSFQMENNQHLQYLQVNSQFSILISRARFKKFNLDIWWHGTEFAKVLRSPIVMWFLGG